MKKQHILAILAIFFLIPGFLLTGFSSVALATNEKAVFKDGEQKLAYPYEDCTYFYKDASQMVFIEKEGEILQYRIHDLKTNQWYEGRLHQAIEKADAETFKPLLSTILDLKTSSFIHTPDPDSFDGARADGPLPADMVSTSSLQRRRVQSFLKYKYGEDYWMKELACTAKAGTVAKLYETKTAFVSDEPTNCWKIAKGTDLDAIRESVKLPDSFIRQAVRLTGEQGRERAVSDCELSEYQVNLQYRKSVYSNEILALTANRSLPGKAYVGYGQVVFYQSSGKEASEGEHPYDNNFAILEQALQLSEW